MSDDISPEPVTEFSDESIALASSDVSLLEILSILIVSSVMIALLKLSSEKEGSEGEQPHMLKIIDINTIIANKLILIFPESIMPPVFCLSMIISK